LNQDIVLRRHTWLFSLSALLHVSHNASDCDHMHLYVCVTKFLTVLPAGQWYSNWSVFPYCVLFTQRKCTENTFIREKYSLLPDFFDFHLSLQLQWG
jgi:hypothetical protein